MNAYAKKLKPSNTSRTAQKKHLNNVTDESGSTRSGLVAQRQFEQLLSRRPQVQSLIQTQEAFDKSPRVLAQEERARAALQRKTDLGDRLDKTRQLDHHSPVAQLALSNWLSGAAGASLGAYAGSYLDYVVPYNLGTLGLGALGGLAGYFAPSALRWLKSGKLWDEVNKDDRGYRTWNTPQNLADQLTESSPEFAELRLKANKAVKKKYKRDLVYSADSDSTGSFSAGYAKGKVRIDESNHPAVSLQNIIFETANAAQTDFFDQVKADAENKSLATNTLDHYGELLHRNPRELVRFAKEYETGDIPTRRSLLQEWGEWNSLQIAKRTFNQIKGRLTSDTAQIFWDLGFGELINLSNFDQYYESRGSGHRAQVEKWLRTKQE